MALLNPRRLVAPLLAACAAVAALGFVDGSLAAAFGRHPRWLPPQLYSGAVSPIGGRIARVEQMKADGEVDDARMVAVIGTSAVEEGLDPRVLAAADPRHRTWLICAKGGGSVREVQVYGQVLIDSALRPPLAVVGLEESMFHSQDEWSHPGTPVDFPRDLQGRHINAALMDVSWLDLNRDSLVDFKTLLFYRLTRSIQGAMGLPESGMFIAESDPWSAPSYRYDNRLPAAALAYQLASLQPRIDPREYESNGRQVRALEELVRDLRAKGAKVIVVLMPETSAFRAMQPTIIRRRFNEALAALVAAGESLEVIDLRESMPDDLFYDYIHLNQRGRDQFSRMLPGLLQ